MPLFYVFRKFLPLALLLSGLLARAQITLIGRIEDAQTKEKLSGAAVRFGNGMPAYSDDSGHYSLQVKESAGSVQVVLLGYRPATLQVSGLMPGEIRTLNFVLEPENKGLYEVVIAADRTPQLVRSSIASVDLIKPYIIRDRNVVDLKNALDLVPAVHVTDGQANIRGGSGWSYGTGSRVMVLVDGLPLLSGDAGQVQWNALPVENIGNMEVIKGSSSVMFGSSALNGIINITTRKPAAEPVTEITAFTGVYDRPPRENLRWTNNWLSTSGLQALHLRKLKGMEYSISANYLRDEGYRMSESDTRLRTAFNTRFFHPKKDMQYGINGNVLLSENGSFLLWESYDFGFTTLDSGFTTTRQYKINLDPYLIWKSGAFDHAIRTRIFRLNNDVDNGDPTNDQSNSSMTYYGEYQARYRDTALKLELAGGLVGQLANTNSPLFEGTQQATNVAAFLQADKTFGKLLASAGMRYERYSLNDYIESRPVFRFGVNYQVARFTNLRASYGEGYRFPSIAESYIQTSVGIVNVFPNPALRSETGWNAEVGVKQGLGLGKSRGWVDAAFFVMEYQNMMEFTFAQWQSPQSPLFGLGFKSVNVGAARISGADFSLNGESRAGKVLLRYLAGYTYMNPISLEPEKEYSKSFAGTPLSFESTSSNPESGMLKYRFRHMAKADIAASYRRFMLGAGVRFNSFMENIDRAFVDFPINLFVRDIEKARESGRNGDYFIDIRGSYDLSTAARISFTINNLLNRIAMTRPADLRPPRAFGVQMRYIIK